MLVRSLTGCQIADRAGLVRKAKLANTRGDDTDLRRHAWMSYMVDKPPSVDKLLQREVRIWEPKEHRPVLTMTRSAFKTYSTCVTQSLQQSYQGGG